MKKSLGDYNIAQSSSSNIKNIKWTKKNTNDPEKIKIKKTKPKNIFYISSITKKNLEPQQTTSLEKIFKIKTTINKNIKNKKTKLKKRFQTSSLSNCNIEQGYRRPGR